MRSSIRAHADRLAPVGHDVVVGRVKPSFTMTRSDARLSYYSHRRFHEALLALGSPPLGLMGSIFD